MSITRSKIKAIGKKLRGQAGDSQLSLRDISILTEWREAHGSSLNYLMKLLETLLEEREIEKTQYSLTQRIKRIYSIKLKLNRFENMQLSTMDDIAGARVILNKISQVQDLYNDLKEKRFKYTLLKVNNYVAKPKVDGYRSIHLVYRTSTDPSIQMELQLRTDLQHIWATAVEVFGTIVSTSFKTGDGEEKWRTFFNLLSSKFAQKENTPVLCEHESLSRSKLDRTLVKTIKELNAIEKLNAFTSDYHSDWENKRKKGRMGKYALLILDNVANTTEVEFYSEKNRLEGLRRYSEMEKNHLNDEKRNSVFISVNDMNKLQQAYPNYFMDTKILLNYLSLIVLGDFDSRDT